MEEQNGRRSILVCPLDWGIGHATRCVPVIREFLDQGFRVVIGADRRPLAFLQREFPELEYVRFPGTHIVYPEGSGMVLRMLFQLPRLLNGIRREHKVLKQIIRDYDIDIVFSDNRYGLWSTKIPSIFMTHQLQLRIPDYLKWSSPMLKGILNAFIRKFDECWIPDSKDPPNLAGNLSHPRKLMPGSYYIGILSRFRRTENEISSHKIVPFDLLVLLSGPEPQRTILEQKLITQLKKSDLKSVIIRGITENLEVGELAPNIRYFTHLPSSGFELYLKQAAIVI